MGVIIFGLSNNAITNISARSMAGTAIAIALLFLVYAFFKDDKRIKLAIFVLITLLILATTTLLLVTAVQNTNQQLNANLQLIGRQLL